MCLVCVCQYSSNQHHSGPHAIPGQLCPHRGHGNGLLDGARAAGPEARGREGVARGHQVLPGEAASCVLACGARHTRILDWLGLR